MTSSWTLNDKLGWEKNLIKKTFGDQQINSDTIVWMKKYRTEIAASSASLTSTLVAVSQFDAVVLRNVFDVDELLLVHDRRACATCTDVANLIVPS